MESIFRKVRKNPQTVGGKHSKLGEGWDENSEAVTEGVGFYLKYLGSTLLDELPLGESYGEGVSTRAVQRIVEMAKSQAKKLVKVSLKVTPHGIKVVDMDSKDMLFDVSIYRISFCTADKNHDKIFAFIARNTINETMECHAFYCAKQKIAQAVTLSVSQAFNLAKDTWEKTNNAKNTQQNLHNNQVSVEGGHNRVTALSHLPDGAQERVSASSDHKGVPAVPPRMHQVQSAPLIDLLQDSHPHLPKPHSVACLDIDSQSSSPRHGWQTFDESSETSPVLFNLEITADSDNLDDCFSQLAENRSRKACFPAFSTDLEGEDQDESVQSYVDHSSERCLEAFARTRSLEDLMNI
ncbi:low density lipoprotein receptor adapter protein 1-A-like [Dreissena polymorpha]|uniref:PID domain-containing protein n=1 Tax=Dreissena polymorpha TaxID=45954 RepID=A0A9D4CNU7_DREPO|nr:low density lipoprotein receptor adapter protein 1-A-like [Dreissena polymorpha]KAH3728024.1 hypothetical protein DPMN_053970 [Dreissena polymorpha]